MLRFHRKTGKPPLTLRRRNLVLEEISYPLHDRWILVTACGRICMHRKKFNVSRVAAGQSLGIMEVDVGIWLVSFMQ